MNWLGLRANPVGLLLSPAPWAAAWYLLAYLFTGTVLVAAVLTATTTAAALCVTVAGLPLLIAAAAVTRGCATAERARLLGVYRYEVTGRYRSVTQPGLVAELKTRWTDPALWRDLTYLVVLYAPLLALDAAALAVWLTFAAGITLPLWYRYPHHSWVLYVDTLPRALAVAAVCLVGFLLFNYVLVWAARLHAAIARTLLSPPEDPLREAKEVLRRPGPIAREFVPNGP